MLPHGLIARLCVKQVEQIKLSFFSVLEYLTASGLSEFHVFVLDTHMKHDLIPKIGMFSQAFQHPDANSDADEDSAQGLP